MNDIRRTFKFVTLLVAGAGQSVEGENVILVKGKLRRTLATNGANELVSQGVLAANGGQYAPTADARNWLKRKRLALLKEEPVHRAAVNSPPVVSDNDTIIRLPRRSKGEDAAFLAAHHVVVANRVSSLILKSQLRPSVTQNLSVLRQSAQSSKCGGVDLCDMALDCRRRLDQLTNQLPKDCASVVVDICGFGKGLQQIEFERRWPRRSAKLVLRMGLDHAANFWRIGSQAIGPG